ncbi:MAG TPA: ComF family protein [Candidatus Acidoferrales bacterium]|jgi:ComF family protein|nr:ComF family protein [Candidatus Acidoferrales bacterium]
MPLSNSRVYAVRWLETLTGAVASVLFPSGCRLCEALLTRADRLPICDACLKSFRALPEKICERCGQPWTEGGATEGPGGTCGECRERGFAFDVARSFGVYDGALARAIVLMKYERIEPLGTWFAKRLLEAAGRISPQFAPDLIVPVPLHRTRQKGRGFNQVDLFGRPLARRLGLPYRPVLLKRERARPEKHLLHFEERWEAVRGAFVIREGGRVDNLRILLLDDVMTSGATLDACSRALREAGAKSVAGLTIARAVRQGIPVRESFSLKGAR